MVFEARNRRAVGVQFNGIGFSLKYHHTIIIIFAGGASLIDTKGVLV